jgi:hypothetical protein
MIIFGKNIVRICDRYNKEIPYSVKGDICPLCKAINNIGHKPHLKKTLKVDPWYIFWNRDKYVEYEEINEL